MGGFVRYGEVKQEFIMIKGTCPGVCKRVITLRKAIVTPSNSIAKEDIQLKFIDTTSQYGAGRFQTIEEKKEWFGPTKKDRLAESKQKAKQSQNQTGQDLDKYKSKNQQKREKGSKKKGKVSAPQGSKKKNQVETEN